MHEGPGQGACRRRGLLAGLLAALLLGLAPLLAQEECTDCHVAGGTGPMSTKMVVLGAKDAHSDQECTDCHGDLAVPHPEKIPKVPCLLCHGDQAKALDQSSHGARLKAHLERDGAVSPGARCLSCHGKDPHDIRSWKDPDAPVNRKRSVAACLECHELLPLSDVRFYRESVHGLAQGRGDEKAAVCTDCHGSHAIDRFSMATSRVHRDRIPATCGQCHPDQQAAYMASTHWRMAARGYTESPVCTDCHGEHRIRSHTDRESPTYAGNITRTCASCHASARLTAKFGMPADRLSSFAGSFHGLSGGLGNLEAANCASCHAHHLVLPSTDPKSTVHPDNLGTTCGRCHPGAEARFISGKIHATSTADLHWLVAFVRRTYIWVILFTLGGMILHNLLDLICKATRGAPGHRLEALPSRFSVNERIQHGLLLSSFLILAVSGFALEHPDSAFGLAFRWLDQGEWVRRTVHRLAALLFVLLAVYHGAYAAATRRGRRQIALLRPRWTDFLDMAGMLRRYLGPIGRPLRLGHYSYVEKFEYWAVVWGGVIMTVTGGLLYFIDFTLANLPLWVAELARTVHYWEAVLASLAILVWHFYWVFLDPEIYPMNLTWLLGRPRPESREADKGA